MTRRCSDFKGSPVHDSDFKMFTFDFKVFNTEKKNRLLLQELYFVSFLHKAEYSFNKAAGSVSHLLLPPAALIQGSNWGEESSADVHPTVPGAASKQHLELPHQEKRDLQ